MPIPFAAAASMPLLAGGGGLAAGGAAAAGGLGSTLFGVGSALSGGGSLLSSFLGGGQADYSQIYGPMAGMAANNVRATLAGQELAAMTGAYTGLLGARSNVAQESALGQFDVAKQKDLSSSGLQLGIAASAADKKQQLDLQRGSRYLPQNCLVLKLPLV
jgi:hypothetical protein